MRRSSCSLAFSSVPATGAPSVRQRLNEKVHGGEFLASFVVCDEIDRVERGEKIMSKWENRARLVGKSSDP